MSQPALIGYQSQRGFGRKNLDPNGNFDIFLGCGRPARSLVTVLTMVLWIQKRVLPNTLFLLLCSHIDLRTDKRFRVILHSSLSPIRANSLFLPAAVKCQTTF